MLQESDIIPYHLSHPPGERILVFAPHPDDETIGCGGTIRLLVQSKKSVKVIFLTSGDKADSSNKLSGILQRIHTPAPLSRGDIPSLPVGEGKGEGGFSEYSHLTEYALLREKEAIKALKILSISDYEFLRFPDRALHEHYQDVLKKLLEMCEVYKPDTIYSPSMIELNPDHRTTASIALEIQRIVMNGGRVGPGVMPVRLMFYEVTTPLRPNMLIDITSVYGRKKRAIKKYASQLKLMDYLKHITALNVFRALTVNGASCVEAFWCMDKPLNSEDIIKWLSYQRAISGHS